MSDLTNGNAVYDAERPWLRDESDDPSRANWLAEFGVPFGRTRKPVFLRGQMFLAIIRIFLLLAALAFNFAMGAAMGAAVGFGGLFVLLICSLVSHVRRLNDAGRPAFLVGLITLPLIISSVFLMLGIMSAPMALEAMQKGRGQAPAVASEASTDGAVSVEENEEDGAVEDDGSTTEPAPARQGPQGRGRGGPPLTLEMISKGVVMQSLGVWLGLSLISMLFSFFYVARGKSSGQTDEDAGLASGISQPRLRPEFYS